MLQVVFSIYWFEHVNQSLTHHFYKVGISFKIVLQSVDDQVIFALCMAQDQHVQYTLQMKYGI